MKQQIVDKVRAAGIVGAGGAGFPTHVKLNAEVERVLGNGASCEPLLMSDPYIMEHYPEDILRGLQIVMECTGAKKGTICLKGKHHAAMNAMEKTAGEREQEAWEWLMAKVTEFLQKQSEEGIV